MGDLAIGGAALLLLTQEIRVDRDALERHARVLREALATKPWPEGSPTLSVVAVAAHHYYEAAQAIFERVTSAFEGPPERSDRWHQHLLERMTQPLEGTRPAVLRLDTARALAPVLEFRQFFRHAYAAPLEPRRLELAAGDVLRAHALLREDLDMLDRTLVAAARGA
jgi:hypothetical protein